MRTYSEPVKSNLSEALYAGFIVCLCFHLWLKSTLLHSISPRLDLQGFVMVLCGALIIRDALPLFYAVWWWTHFETL